MAKANEKAKEVAAEEVTVEKTETKKADEVKNTDDRVSYVLPMNVLGNQEVVEACLNGKVYQITCGEPVKVPKALAEVLDNAIKQRRKVNKMIKEREKKSQQIS